MHEAGTIRPSLRSRKDPTRKQTVRSSGRQTRNWRPAPVRTMHEIGARSRSLGSARSNAPAAISSKLRGLRCPARPRSIRWVSTALTLAQTSSAMRMRLAEQPSRLAASAMSKRMFNPLRLSGKNAYRLSRSIIRSALCARSPICLMVEGGSGVARRLEGVRGTAQAGSLNPARGAMTKHAG